MVNDIPLLPDRGVNRRMMSPKLRELGKNTLVVLMSCLSLGWCLVCVYPIDIYCHTNATKTLSVHNFSGWAFFFVCSNSLFYYYYYYLLIADFGVNCYQCHNELSF